MRGDQESEQKRAMAGLQHTTTKIPIGSKGNDRVLDCIAPTKGIPPPSAKRLVAFATLLDMLKLYFQPENKEKKNISTCD